MDLKYNRIPPSSGPPLTAAEGDLWYARNGDLLAMMGGKWIIVNSAFSENSTDQAEKAAQDKRLAEIEAIKKAYKFTFHVEPKKDTVINTVVKQNIFQEALDKLKIDTKVKLPSKD